MNNINLRNWLNHPDRKGVISIAELERKIDCPRSTLGQWLTGKRPLPQKWEKPLLQQIEKLTFLKPPRWGKTPRNMKQVTEEYRVGASRNETRYGFDCRYNNYNNLLKINGLRVLSITDHGEESGTTYTVYRSVIEGLGLALKTEVQENDKVLGFVFDGHEGFKDWRGFGSDSEAEKLYVVVP